MQHRLVATPVVMVAGLAWLVLAVVAITGQGAVIRHDRLLTGGPPLWLATLLFLGGWQVMVWAMMVPASLHAFNRLSGVTALVAFASGYLVVWTAFGLLIFLFDAGVHATVNHTPWLASHPWLIAGATLVVVGTYQLSGLKERSLTACRRLEHIPTSQSSAVQGLVHGTSCLGASWGLMLAAFAFGAGSLPLMAAIALAMVWEVSQWGAGSVKILGYCLIALGVFVLAGAIPR